MAGMINVAPGSQAQVTLEEIWLSSLNDTHNVPKVVVTGSGGKGSITNLTINRLQMGGYSSAKHTNTSGLTIQGLSKGDLVNIIHIDGDIHAIANDGLILVGFHTGGQVTIEGKSSRGFFGERVKFTCCFHDYGTKIIGPQTYACAAYYQESGPNLFKLSGAAVEELQEEGGADDHRAATTEAAGELNFGNVAINGIKLGATNYVNSEFIGWAGSFFQTGGWAFTQDNKASNMTIKHTGKEAFNLTMTMAYPWNYPYTFDLQPAAKLTQIAAMQHDTSGLAHRVKDVTWAGSAESIRRGYDLLKRFGRLDLAVNYPHVGVTDTCGASALFP